jgi:hypothetical protein
MTVTAEGLVDVLVGILQGNATATPPVPPPTAAAAADIQAYREWSISTLNGLFDPKITFDLPEEVKDGIGRAGASQFTTTGLIVLHGFVSARSAAAPGSDGGEIRVRQALISLRRQIEVAIVNNPALWDAGIQQIKRIRSASQTSKDTNGFHLGELRMEFALEYYQGPEDFDPFTPVDLDDVNVSMTVGDNTVPAATFDIDLSCNT